MKEKKHLIVIAGPTATGKTGLAIEIAKKYHTEIISADSRQLFGELKIGVARPDEEQLASVKHHFIACRSVQEDYTAGMFEKDALDCLNGIFKKKEVAVMAGGSGLYLKAVCDGLDDVPEGEREIKELLNKELAENGLPALQKKLQQLDPAYYSAADIQNPRRVLRALEVCLTSGKPFSSYHQSSPKKRPFHLIKVGISPERKILYEKINQRVDEMMQRGLLEEVKKLKPFQELASLQTVGYKEFFDFLDGKTDLETAISLIKQNTRHYAKRQMTWFRKDKSIQWFDGAERQPILNFIERDLKS